VKQISVFTTLNFENNSVKQGYLILVFVNLSSSLQRILTSFTSVEFDTNKYCNPWDTLISQYMYSILYIEKHSIWYILGYDYIEIKILIVCLRMINDYL
jgi:hypothetical protein